MAHRHPQTPSTSILKNDPLMQTNWRYGKIPKGEALCSHKRTQTEAGKKSALLVPYAHWSGQMDAWPNPVNFFLIHARTQRHWLGERPRAGPWLPGPTPVFSNLTVFCHTKAAVTHIFFTFFTFFSLDPPKKWKESRSHTKKFPTPKKFSLFNSNPKVHFFSLWAKMGGGLRRPPARVPIVQDP